MHSVPAMVYFYKGKNNQYNNMTSVNIDLGHEDINSFLKNSTIVSKNGTLYFGNNDNKKHVTTPKEISTIQHSHLFSNCGRYQQYIYMKYQTFCVGWK